MFNLIIAIACSALLSILMRLSKRFNCGQIPMLTCNYIVCAALSLCLTRPTVPSGSGTTVLLGVFNGAVYLLGFILLQWNIGKNGVILSATFMKLGILVPTLLSIVVFGELPSVVQILGMVLTVCAILFMNLQKGAGHIRGIFGLIVLLLCGGMGDGLSKVFERVCDADQDGLFLSVTFVVATLMGLSMVLIRRERIGKWDWLFGLLIGAPNYFCTYFLLNALTELPAIIVFPSFSIGVIAVVALVGSIVFHEKLTGRQWIALGGIAVALALLNL